jgi:hypothetical protein
VDGAVGGGPSWVDSLSDAEAVARVRAVAARLEPALGHLSDGDRASLRASLFPLWQRVRALSPSAVMTAPCASPAPRPAGIDDALALLLVPDRSRRTNVVVGFLDGLLAGRGDDRGFDNGWGEGGRIAGHLLSGFFIAGNLRDLAFDIAHGEALDALLDGAAAIPLAGDLLETGEAVARGADELHDADRALEAVTDARRAAGEASAATERWTVDLAEHEGPKLGHTLTDHSGQSVEQMESRLAKKPSYTSTSSFPDDASAGQAVDDVLDARRRDIEAWLQTPTSKPEPFVADLGRPVGTVLQRGTAPVATTSARVVLIQDATFPLGFRVLTAFPVL